MPILNELMKRRKPNIGRNVIGAFGELGASLQGRPYQRPEEDTDIQDFLAKELIKRQIEQEYPAQMTPYQKASIDLRTKREEKRAIPKPMKPPGQRGFQDTAVVEGRGVVPVRPYVPPQQEKVGSYTVVDSLSREFAKTGNLQMVRRIEKLKAAGASPEEIIEAIEWIIANPEDTGGSETSLP